LAVECWHCICICISFRWVPWAAEGRLDLSPRWPTTGGRVHAGHACLPRHADRTQATVSLLDRIDTPITRREICRERVASASGAFCPVLRAVGLPESRSPVAGVVACRGNGYRGTAVWSVFKRQAAASPPPSSLAEVGRGEKRDLWVEFLMKALFNRLD
jgi:hypothetical protein